MSRLPTPGGDDGDWGNILNDFLGQTLTADGLLKPNVVTTAVLSDASITTDKLDSANQAAINRATTSVQAVNGKTIDGSGAVTVAQTDIAGLTSDIAAKLSIQTAITTYTPLAGTFRRSTYNFKSSNTRYLRAALNKAQSGTGMAHILMSGASIAMGLSVNGDTFTPDTGSPSAFLAKNLVNTGFPKGSTGWVMATVDGSGLSRKDSRWSFNGGFGPILGTYYVLATTANATATFTSDIAGTIAEFVVVGSSAGCTYSIDGASAVNVSLNGNYALQKITLSGLSNTAHTITIMSTTSGPVFLAAARVRGTTGLDISAGAYAGATSGIWLPSADPVAGLGPFWLNSSITDITDCAIVSFDPVINDIWGGSTTAEAAIANIQTQASALKANGDVVLLLPHQVNPNSAGIGGGKVTQAIWNQVVAAGYTMADSLDVPLLDMTERLGDFQTVLQMGIIADDAHLHMHGYSMMARSCSNALRDSS